MLNKTFEGLRQVDIGIVFKSKTNSLRLGIDFHVQVVSGCANIAGTRIASVRTYVTEAIGDSGKAAYWVKTIIKKERFP